MKFYIKDEDGDEFEVEEVIAKKSEEDEDIDTMTNDDNDIYELTSEEITALKSLAAVAKDLIALVKTDSDTTNNEDIDEDIDDDIDKEEVIETDEDTTNMKKVGDAKKSIGRIERKQKRVDDSLEDEVSIAWAKRYNGGNH